MANEVSVTAVLSYFNPLTVSSSIGRGVSGFLANSLTQIGPVGTSVSIGTSATAIPLGGITTPGWAWFRNLDPVNYVQLFNGASGAVFSRLLPGEFALLPLDNGCVPYGKANVAAIDLEYLISSR